MTAMMGSMLLVARRSVRADRVKRYVELFQRGLSVDAARSYEAKRLPLLVTGCGKFEMSRRSARMVEEAQADLEKAIQIVGLG